MKKYFLLFIATLFSFIGCSDDDDKNENKPNFAKEIAGIYDGGLTIYLNGETVTPEPIAKEILLTYVSESHIDLLLKDFQLAMGEAVIKIGDIAIKNATVTENAGIKTIQGTGELSADVLATGKPMEMTLAVNGTIDKAHKANLMIEVGFKDPAMANVMAVKVNFIGTKK